MSRRETRGGIAATALVAALVLAPHAGSAAQEDAEGSVAAFCARWDDARSALLNEALEQRDDGLLSPEEAADLQLAVVDEVEPTVPAEIRDEWQAAADNLRATSEVLFTVGFEPERVRPIHLELAFGDTDPQEAESDARTAIAAIDEWTVTGCGDFCARWPQIQRSMTSFTGPGDTREVRAREEIDIEFLRSIDVLVPDEVRTAWDESMRWRSIVNDAITSDSDLHLDEYFEQQGLNLNLEEYLEQLDERLEPVGAWVDANCEAIGVAGAPGTLTVRAELSPELTGSDILIAVVPPGAPITGLDSNDELLGGRCNSVGTPGDVMEGVMVQPTDSTELCQFLAGEQGEEAAVLDGGEYDVVALTVIGLGPGDLTGYLPPPEHCIRVRVAIDGNTSIELPPLKPCSLGPLAGDPEDAEDLAAPTIDASEPGAGTVRVVLPDAASPVTNPDMDPGEQDAGGTIVAIALPSGTELEEVGRRDTWPSGVVCLRTFTPQFVERQNPEDRAGFDGPLALPLAAMPPTAHPPACFGREAGRALDLGVGPPARVFAAGTYDLYLEANVELGALMGYGEDSRRCHVMTVDVDGDTDVEPPPPSEWGPCP